ncbi:Receptor-like protein 12 [Cucumis melo var. makuwa]|uniref:Receptor-like protein 12 n=1 Tax=Cucumis melo var. makuwa TaxID=1194695 RepID=A0A5D3D857_CUCMM|nr:Receptor-like protein 12 [Cucumis melo var. makuwa]
MPSRRHEHDRYRHFQAKCATYLKRKKKSLRSTLSDEETSFVNECKSYGRALISCEIEEVPKKASDDELHAPTVTDTNLQSGTLEGSVHNELKFSPSYFEELLYLWKEDQELLKQHQERFLTLFKDNHRLMTTISTLKFEHRKVRSEYETLVKSVRMLSPGTQRLDNILIIQKNDREGLCSCSRHMIGAPKLNNVFLVKVISTISANWVIKDSEG